MTEQTCADIVGRAWNSRFDDLRAMLDPNAEDILLARDGKEWIMEIIDRTVTNNNGADLPLDNEGLAELCEEATGSDEINPDTWSEAQSIYILTALYGEHEDEIREAAREAFFEYGLGFDYVEPGTLKDQSEGYWRYQLSCGGPQEEIRFYASPRRGGFTLYRAEFWYLNWFDGAKVDVTGDRIVKLVWEFFEDMDAVDHVLREAFEL